MESPILEKLAQAAAEKLIFLEYFVVPLRWPAIGAGLSNEQSAQIPKDSDFLLREINRAFVVGGVVIELPDALMDLVDSGSGRLFNTSVRPHVLTVTGTGERPYILPEPRIIAGGNAVSATIENIGASTVERAHISMIGTKIFYRGSFSLAELVPER